MQLLPDSSEGPNQDLVGAEESGTLTFKILDATLVALRLPVVALAFGPVWYKPPTVDRVHLRSAPHATPLLPNVFWERVLTCETIPHRAAHTARLEAYEPK